MTSPLFLFDISAYLHRAMYVCYGDRVAETSETDARFVQHACGMLANTMERLNIERMAVVCDSTDPSFRCDYFPAYKAERKPHYPVFAAQAPWFYDQLRDMSVAVVSAPRFEADDLIASMLGCSPSCTVVSSDKDLLALLRNGSVDYYDPMKNAHVNAGDVREKFGVAPSQLYDYTGLVGDKSDGIPGVPGFGPKTVSRLLREFGSLDEVFNPDRRAALEEFLTVKQTDKLMKHQDDALMSRRLARPVINESALCTEPGGFEAPSPGIVRRACS